MTLPLDQLDLLATPADLLAGAPMSLAIDLIDEDPLQPRSEFDAEALPQLADTIAQRGVRQPISVRPHPEQPGRWMLNFGARRLRASVLAGRAEIPAFVDATADSYDQGIENEQRDGLRPIELALFVQRQMAAGQSQAGIARRLGKSRACITYVCALIDPPHWLMSLYREGRCRGIKEIYDLRRLHEEHPGDVSEWLSARRFVSRGDVEAMKARLDAANPEASLPDRSSVPTVARPSRPSRPPVGSAPATPASSAASSEANPSSAARLPQSARRAIPEPALALLAECDGQTVRVWLDAAPEQTGSVFVNAVQGGSRRAVAIEVLQSLRLVQCEAR